MGGGGGVKAGYYTLLYKVMTCTLTWNWLCCIVETNFSPSKIGEFEAPSQIFTQMEVISSKLTSVLETCTNLEV